MKQADSIIGKTISKLVIKENYWDTKLYFRFTDNSFASFEFPTRLVRDDNKKIDVQFNTRFPSGTLLGIGLISEKEAEEMEKQKEIDTYNRIKEKYNLA